MQPLTEKQRAAANAAGRAYYARNREKCLAQTYAYHAANPERIKKLGREYYYRHREERLAKSAIYQKKNKDKIRIRNRKWRGLPNPTRPEPRNCECCERPGIESRAKRLELDHCHETGAFRGWLCHRCNLGIGQLRDSITGVRAALEYLERHECQMKLQ